MVVMVFFFKSFVLHIVAQCIGDLVLAEIVPEVIIPGHPAVEQAP